MHACMPVCEPSGRRGPPVGRPRDARPSAPPRRGTHTVEARALRQPRVSRNAARQSPRRHACRRACARDHVSRTPVSAGTDAWYAHTLSPRVAGERTTVAHERRVTSERDARVVHSPTGAWGGAVGAEPRSRGRVGSVGMRLRADTGNVTRCAACVLIRGKYEKRMASACRENAARARAPARRHGPRGGEGGVCVCGGGGGLRRSLPRRCTTAPLRARRRAAGSGPSDGGRGGW